MADNGHRTPYTFKPPSAATLEKRHRPNAAKWLERPNSMRGAFVREYLIDMSPTNAAIRAGYTPATAQETGRMLLKVPPVADAIKRALASRSKRVGLNADTVFAHLARLINTSPKAFYDDAGVLKLPQALDDDDAFLIAGVQTRRIVEINPDTGKMHNVEIQNVKFADRAPLLALAMRHLGMMNDKLTIDVGGTLAEQLAQAQARIEGGVAEVDADTGLSAGDMEAIEAEERLLIEGMAEEIEEPSGLPPEYEDLI